ncbi:hypothetical protein CLV40_10932 [Actinokineospora auranticolor]|uniref:Uncharacterized protein n=1 Tax=Actinokineospora auranticolor TaxID=155976 RepID=A0A2S6GN52_9PSEU|nr:hypothetical protein CLV40_10932 [Actinokineospora auranticolor]
MLGSMNQTPDEMGAPLTCRRWLVCNTSPTTHPLFPTRHRPRPGAPIAAIVHTNC